MNFRTSQRPSKSSQWVTSQHHPATAISRLLVTTLLLVSGSAIAQAGIITGDTVTASHVSGVFGVLTPAASVVPASWTVGFSGFPLLDITLDDNGLIEVNPNAQSCSSGCGWGAGSDFLFTFASGSPAITGLSMVHSDGALNATLSLVDSQTFELSFGPGGGTTNVNFETAQLTFAPAAVPEPASLCMAGIGLVLVGFANVRRKLRS
jgi:hypothetical protein